jgi:hypothetical protein
MAGNRVGRGLWVTAVDASCFVNPGAGQVGHVLNRINDEATIAFLDEQTRNFATPSNLRA